MKQITCKQMGGPCDAVFKGETSGEIATAAAAHIEEMAKTDSAHQATYDEMAEIASNPDSHKQWQEDFQDLFDEEPDVDA
jgi:thiamine biosynthesis protein ThiC